MFGSEEKHQKTGTVMGESWDSIVSKYVHGLAEYSEFAIFMEGLKVNWQEGNAGCAVRRKRTLGKILGDIMA